MWRVGETIAPGESLMHEYFDTFGSGGLDCKFVGDESNNVL